MIDAPLHPTSTADIRAAYAKLCADAGASDIAVAVRSSTAEDLPDASFAGQQETFLNVTGADDVVRKVKEVFASSTTTAPSPTACTTASPTRTCSCPPACS